MVAAEQTRPDVARKRERWKARFGGIGAILTLHHVRAAQPQAFQPNRLLEVTPVFLEKVVAGLRRAGIDLISLDEMHRRLADRVFWRKFVCFTLDDGYRDNLEHAWPIFKRHGVPFAIYLPTSFPDRLGELWRLALEAVIARYDRISLEMDGEDRHFDCHTTSAKYAGVPTPIYWWLRGLATEEDLRRVIRDLCQRYRNRHGVLLHRPVHDLGRDRDARARSPGDGR